MDASEKWLLMFSENGNVPKKRGTAKFDETHKNRLKRQRRRIEGKSLGFISCSITCKKAKISGPL